MNILPHKSWHVRTKKNIERVRRDEEKAAEEEKERQRKIALAEQEARTDLLRQKAKKRIGDGSEVNAVENGEGSKLKVVTFEDITSEVVEAEPLQHVNFFSEIEDGKKLSGTKNTEHEADKKKEQEQLEIKIGLLTYLGQGSAESQTEKPWYLKRGRNDQDAEDLSKNWKIKKKLDADDPMKQMEEYVDKKKKSSHKEKHKHKKHKQSHKSKSDSQLVTPTTGKSISELRAERLKREAMEKQKSENLLRKLRGEEIIEDKPVEETSSRGQKYNSQYNPELLRQPRSHGVSDYKETKQQQQEFDSSEFHRGISTHKRSYSDYSRSYSDNKQSHRNYDRSRSDFDRRDSVSDRSSSDYRKSHSHSGRSRDK